MHWADFVPRPPNAIRFTHASPKRDSHPTCGLQSSRLMSLIQRKQESQRAVTAWAWLTEHSRSARGNSPDALARGKKGVPKSTTLRLRKQLVNELRLFSPPWTSLIITRVRILCTESAHKAECRFLQHLTLEALSSAQISRRYWTFVHLYS